MCVPEAVRNDSKKTPLPENLWVTFCGTDGFGLFLRYCWEFYAV